MSLLRRKKPAKKTLSDTIAELLLPQPLLDPEIDGADETVAQTRAYDEGDDDDELGEIDPRMSEIRKRNVKLLQDVDRKYSGKISSRKDFEEEEEDEDEDDDEEEEEVAYEDSSDDEVEEAKRSKVAVDTDSESEDEVDDEDEDEVAVEDEDDEAESEVEDDDEDVEDDEDDDVEDAAEDDDDDSASDFDDNADIDLAPKSSKIAVESAVSDSTVTVRPANVGADLQKGHCVQNQLHIWEKLLEMRIHSQKILINANTLPAHTQLNAMAAESSQLSDAVAATGRTVSTLLDRLTELQTQLVAQFPETSALNPRKRRHDDDAAAADVREDAVTRRIRRHGEHLAERHDAYTEYRNAVLLKWYDRTKVLTPGTREGRHAAQHNVLQNIDGILANRGELVRKTQLHKGGYTIMGGPVATAVKKVVDAPRGFDDDGDKDEAAAEELYAPEIYDDSDFYHTQLRELIEFKANAASTPDEMNRQFVELQKLRKKMKKQVDTRASKGRKIRYVVHNKMVNFMARNEATDWTEEAKTELYSSLFGARMGGDS